MPHQTTGDRFPTPPDPDLPPSLAGVQVGDEVLVRRILLNLVRVMCRERGISVGDRLLIEARTDEDVMVRNGKGRSARLPHPYAYFVHVGPGRGEAEGRA